MFIISIEDLIVYNGENQQITYPGFKFRDACTYLVVFRDACTYLFVFRDACTYLVVFRDACTYLVVLEMRVHT